MHKRYARYSYKQQDVEHSSTVYHNRNELALCAETGTGVQCAGSGLLDRQQEQADSWRDSSTGYRAILLQVTADWHPQTGTAIFTPCPLNKIISVK
jgi:hypothetical protein